MKTTIHAYDFVVVGGGLSGIAAAVMAARGGLKTALVNDRPCLGGNASKEMLTPPIGAHYADGNFAYHRETGLLEELLLENLNNNPQGNPELWDLNLQTLVYHEKNIDLFLNMTIQQVKLNHEENQISSVEGYCLESDDWHIFSAPLFADCSGNGVIGFNAGAPFMRGAEGRDVFGESFAPEKTEQREMGCSLRFRTKDTGRPVHFTKPAWVKHSFTFEDFEKRHLEEAFRTSRGGFWWLEWGGMLDTISEMKTIKAELTSILYAIWHYLKNNSPIKDEILNYDLDWVGAIPGRRENRRFTGDYILTQQDIEEQRSYEDSIAYGGWGFDDHPPLGLFEKGGISFHFMHSGPYNIPLRCLYSKKIENLFFAGRNISVSHMALTTTRVQDTCFQLGDAVGAAAAICGKYKILPREASKKPYIKKIQECLNLAEHTIFDHPLEYDHNIAGKALVSASSVLPSPRVTGSAGTWPLSEKYALMFPVITGHLDSLKLIFDAEEDTNLSYTIHGGQKALTNIPGTVLKEGNAAIKAGKKMMIQIDCGISSLDKGWYFIELEANKKLAIHYGIHAPTGLKTFQHHNMEIEKNRTRTDGSNREWDIIKDLETEPCCLVEIMPPQPVYESANVQREPVRPTFAPNLWISGETDFTKPEYLEFIFKEPENLESIQIIFDSSLDNSVSGFCSDCNCMVDGYTFNRIPSLVKGYRIYIKAADSDQWQPAVEVQDNYQRLRRHDLNTVAKALRLEIINTNGWNRAQIYGIRLLRKDKN
ncbi:hypothetical protein AGMMS49546_11060 [Spirochaetia bacterium]|nr:hypothetical protein AGMMS49546_11060 [Spirochaetia bacterium]